MTDNKVEDEEDDSDEDSVEVGPGIRGYVCDTRDRDSSESFQESIFNSRLYE